MRPDVDDALARLRAEKPIAWHEHPDSGRGFWSLTTHAHVSEVTSNPAQFTSSKGIRIAIDPEMGLEQVATRSMLEMDPPEHTRYRRLVSPMFTPRAMESQMPMIRKRARALIDEIRDKGRIDFYAEVAAQMPLHIISGILGIPESDRDYVHGLVNTAVNDSADHTRVDGAAAVVELKAYGRQLSEERRKKPADDLLSTLATSQVDGDALTTEQLGDFFAPLFTAGNETTRATMAHGLVAITENEALREPFLAMSRVPDFRLTAELVRWATPVRAMRRTVVSDMDFHGVRMRAGDKVVIWYTSANRDETVIDDANLFNPMRDPNRHVSFGAGGPHFCIGNNLAQREICVLFDELLSTLPDIHQVGTPQKSRLLQFNAYDKLEVEFTPR
jgi:cytochrome P450